MPTTKDKQKSPRRVHVTNLEITRIGQQGDGMALIDTAPVSFPLTMPGDIISGTITNISKNRYTVSDIHLEKSGSDRTKPPCPYHATLDKNGCGGCALQFIKPSVYRAWKSNLPVDCLKKSGVSVETVEFMPLVPVPEKSRRRAVFSAFHDGRSVTLGFYEQGSNRVIPWQECLVITPELSAIKDTLSDGLSICMKPHSKMRIHCTALEKQSDITFTSSYGLEDNHIKLLQQWAKACGHTRVSWQTTTDNSNIADVHILYEQNPVTKLCGAFSVNLPPGTFLQPSAQGEQALLKAVFHYLSSLSNIDRAMDLFCGLGTFTLPLYEYYPHMKSLQAFDSNGDAIKSLHTLSQQGKLAGLAVQPRDLFIHPITAQELRRMDAVVIDPPRVGAKAQCEQLALSRVPHIVMVSCNPVTMARDAKILCDGGYTLQSVTSVDQFLWSHHLETVSFFARKP